MDTLRRDDLPPHRDPSHLRSCGCFACTQYRKAVTAAETAKFDALSPATQRVLRRAATRGAANSTPAIRAEVDADWLMVPTRRGVRQVALTETRAYTL